MKIGNVEINGKVIPAPLAGYTNSAYRKLLLDFGAAFCVSEMISDCALIYNNKETYEMLKIEEDDHPVALQIFGGKKETILEGAKIIFEKAKCDFLDVNLGCPVNKVIKGNAGSSWLKKEREDELEDMMTSLVKISPIPVFAKIRLGWTKEDINCLDVAKRLQRAGVKLIAIHGRTRSEFYDGKANHEYAKKIKETIDVPIAINGDIDSPFKAKELLDYTHADFVMIGRPSLGDPHIIKRIDTYLKEGIILDSPTLEMQKEFCIKHYLGLKALKGEYKALHELRSVAPLYFKGFSYSKKTRIALSKMEKEEDFYNALNSLNRDD